MATRSRVLALVMAGGAGSRMAPLTDHRAKPVLPYGGVYRLIDFPLSNCTNSGISDVWVLEQYEPYALGSHLAGGRPWDLDRSHGGLQVLFPHQGDAESGWHQGNADAIYHIRSVLRDFDADVVVVLSADHVYALDYRDVVEAHLGHEAELTMVTTVVPEAHASRFGNIEVGDDGRVAGFVYKPDEPVSDVVTTEVFVFDGATLLDAVDELVDRSGGAGGDEAGGDEASDDEEGDDEEGEASLEDLGDQLLPHLVERGRVWEHRFEGYWRDVGTLESYWRSHLDLVEDEPPLRLDDPAWPIRSGGSSRPPARLFRSASVDRSLISPGCRVRGTVESSVLGPGVVVEPGAVVRSSVLFDGAVIEAGARVSGAICAMETRVGRDARVGLEDRPDAGCSEDDLVVLGEGVQVGAGTEVDPGTRPSR